MLRRINAIAAAALESGALRELKSLPSFCPYDAAATGGPSAVIIRSLEQSKRTKDNLRSKEKTPAGSVLNPLSRSPFNPPEPELLIESYNDGAHHLLWNKFCVMRPHLLLVAAPPASQRTDLAPADLAALRTLCFYNCGELSGASQEQRHIQITPAQFLLDDGTPFRYILDALCSEAPKDAQQIDSLAYDHEFIALDDSSDWAECYAEIVGRLRARYTESELSYNMLCTPRWMIVIPRSKADWTGDEVEGALSMNSMGYAGSLFCRTEAMADYVRLRTPAWFLLQCSYPKQSC